MVYALAHQFTWYMTWILKCTEKLVCSKQKKTCLDTDCEYEDFIKWSEASFSNFIHLVVLQMWPELLQKSKAGGLNAIQTYVFWDGHEPQEGQVSTRQALTNTCLITSICPPHPIHLLPFLCFDCPDVGHRSLATFEKKVCPLLWKKERALHARLSCRARQASHFSTRASRLRLLPVDARVCELCAVEL